jgi:hypothetical protein
MKQHRLIAGITAAFVIILVGVLIFHKQLGIHVGTSSPTEEVAGTVVDTGIQTAQGQVPEAIAPEFAFRRLEIDTSKPQAEACLVFTRTLDDSGKTRYGDYLKFEPEIQTAIRVTGDRLCIAGLAFNQTYNVTLKAGLPAARNNEKLVADETIPVELRDRPPIVRFEGGILLPRDSVDGVPVTTVNIAKLKIKIIRVGDRLLSQLETGVVDQTTIYGYDESRLEREQGSVVWQGEMDVRVSKNEPITTLIPIRSILPANKPGAYIVMAADGAKPNTQEEGEEGGYNSYWDNVAVQWVIDSDIGLTSFRSDRGLSVFARSFKTANPVSGLRLTLVARNNNVLEEKQTDSSGRADFSQGLLRGTGGDEPVAVMAYGQGGDFTFLDLRRPAFDLTDRGVEGRDPPGPVDAYLYTERGVYRPGEAVEATALLRDETGHATSAPLTLVLTRPDGVEFRKITYRADELMGGGKSWHVVLTNTAPHGRWQIAAYIDRKAAPVGRVSFDVADFVPQRLKVTLTPETRVLQPNTDFSIRQTVRFLYGAPAAGLGGEGEMRIGKASQPFPAFKEFQFGRENETFNGVVVTPTVPETDETGTARVTGNVGDLPDVSMPLSATIRVSVFEPGGRTTDNTVTLPVKTRDLWLGLRPQFDGGSVAEGARASFQAIAVDANGRRVARSGLHYQFVRETTVYNWFQVNGQWKYESVIRTRLVASATFSVAADKPTLLAQSLPWGSYRLTITDPATGAATSMSFWSGWAGSSAGDRPDRVAVTSDREKYRPGDTARIRIAPQFDGKALVIVAGDKLYSSQLIDTPKSGATIDIDVSPDWGAGAYVLVTEYRPLGAADEHAPVRAVGLVWLGVDNSTRTLTATIGGPPKMIPRQPVTIPISVAGLSSGEEAFVTLAAVDEGILQLTAFKTPDPVGHYFGKRRLGLGMHDDYGRLIQKVVAPMGAVRTGGDSFGGRPLAVVPTKTVALFYGPVRLVNGRADITVAVPDFNGELRLMAIVWSKDKVGAASRPLTVRDPVVGELVLPRFLAPGDSANAALNLHNVEGRPGAYIAIVRASGAAALPGGARETRMTHNLAVGQRMLIPVPVTGAAPGIATISLSVTGPNFAVNRSWPIEVRAPQLDINRDEVLTLAAGQSWTADANLANGIVPATATVAINVSTTRSYSDVAGMLRWLDKYPLGCLEQTTSRAMPLLVFNDLAPQAGIRMQDFKPRIQTAVDSVLDMQATSGGFGLWGPSADTDRYISVFAMDFLYQAKARGFIVADEGLRRGARYLQETAASDSHDDNTRAYAFYVLARENKVNLSDLRYFTDTRALEMKTSLAPALAGAALSQVGDRARSRAIFARASEIAMTADPAAYDRIAGDYGSLLRDVAGTTSLVAEGGAIDMLPALLRRSSSLDMRLNGTTTQEKAWMLRAAYQLSRQRQPLNVTVNGAAATPIDGAVRLSPSLAQLQRGLTFRNNGTLAVWRSVSVSGSPASPLPAESEGVTITKTLWTMDGKELADLSNLKQNERVLVVLQGRMANNYYRRMAVIDLLPVGIEIETTLSGDEGKAIAGLGALTSTDIAEARDDRYVAAFTIGSQYRPAPDPTKPTPPEPQPEFKLAYVMRVVSTGSFQLPAAVVEDMYAPEVRARTSMGTVTATAGR